MQFITGQSLDFVIDALRAAPRRPGADPRYGRRLPPQDRSVTKRRRDRRPDPRVVGRSVRRTRHGRAREPSRARDDRGGHRPRRRPRNSPGPGVAANAHLEIAGRPELASGPSDVHYFLNVARSASRWPRRWRTPMVRAFFIVTSSPRTCCWTPRGPYGSPTSGSPRPRAATDPTQTGDVVGTLRYMAPERFEGRSDPGAMSMAWGPRSTNY